MFVVDYLPLFRGNCEEFSVQSVRVHCTELQSFSDLCTVNPGKIYPVTQERIQ